MFQKLYRHLEEVNSSLRRQETAAGNATSCDKEILQQLRQLNENIRIGQKELQQAVKKRVQVFSVVLFVMACLAVGEIVFLHIRLSNASREFSDSQATADRQFELQSQKNVALYNVTGQQRLLAGQMNRLDTIIYQQSQSLLELKDLNKISVRTFMQLNKRIDQSIHLIAQLQSDSTHYISRANREN